jgi:hypothetical protein
MFTETKPYHYTSDNVVCENGTWVVTYPNLVNRFSSPPAWLKTQERINLILDEAAGAGRDPAALRKTIDGLFSAATRDYFEHSKFGSRNTGNTQEYVEKYVARDDTQSLITIFELRARDNELSSGNCPMAQAYCSESYKYSRILSCLRALPQDVVTLIERQSG